MTHETAAAAIIKWLHVAETELIGRKVATFRGMQGIITDIRLDNDHGLMFTTEPRDAAHRRYFPVSTIRELCEGV